MFNFVILGDSLGRHHKMKFSTKDKDQDTYGNSCAQQYTDAFWYVDCHSVNINGQYFEGSAR